jgi:hypothetical protein
MRCLWHCVAASLLLLAVVDAKGSNQVERKISQSRNQCEASKCDHLFSMENSNCVNQCMSPSCYEQVFGANKGLEDGEINSQLEKQFKVCLRKEHTTRGRPSKNREAEKRKSESESD